MHAHFLKLQGEEHLCKRQRQLLWWCVCLCVCLCLYHGIPKVVKVTHESHMKINHMYTWSALLHIITSAVIEHTPTDPCLHNCVCMFL